MLVLMRAFPQKTDMEAKNGSRPMERLHMQHEQREKKNKQTAEKRDEILRDFVLRYKPLSVQQLRAWKWLTLIK